MSDRVTIILTILREENDKLSVEGALPCTREKVIMLNRIINEIQTRTESHLEEAKKELYTIFESKE